MRERRAVSPKRTKNLTEGGEDSSPGSNLFISEAERNNARSQMKQRLEKPSIRQGKRRAQANCRKHSV
jgi:hypothetical protein